ncbi:MAG TPA: ATP-binding cassette domain-containing protein [Chromatiales bacterium]|nr:ATP-binding cassette domain-containing protein [Chromatiales bacterium]HEX22103.1 ATP-binding cassette domain-containing protein [Chromatiales bacterium]
MSQRAPTLASQTSPRETLVKVEQLTRQFGAHTVVDSVDFEVHRGEVLGFLGPNGAGKTTTMRMITGNLAPSVGRVTINGLDILDRPKAAKAEIGYLPEQPPVYRELTVDEYLRFCARLNRIPRGQVAQAMASAKERCGLGEVGARLIGNLSKGYQQRVGIAQAIIHSPAVVVLDEPTVGLDPIQIREIRHLIRDLGGEHSVILSTHILPEVQATCDRVQIINRGRLVMSDSIEALTRRSETASLLLRLARPPQADVIRTFIPGIEQVVVRDDGTFLLHFSGGRAVPETVAKTVVEQGWGLLELSPERRSLEQIFVDITTGDASSDRETAT